MAADRDRARVLVAALLAASCAAYALLPAPVHAAAAPTETPERFGSPQPAAFALEVRLRGDADQVRVRPEQLALRVERRSAAPHRADKLALDGLGWRKVAADRSPIALRLWTRAVQKGDAPALVVRAGAVGSVQVEVRGAGRLLASGGIAADGPRELRIDLDPRALWRLPALPRQRAERLALAFYYPWYGHPDGPSGRYRHWDPKVANHSAHNTPALGYYDSQDPAVIEQHARWATRAGLDGLVLSWWSRSDPPDALLGRWLDVAAQHRLRLTVYIEDCRDVAGLRETAKHLLSRFAVHPAWLRHRGRPVLFLYGRVLERVGAAGVAAALGDLGAHVNAMGLDTDLLDAVDGLHVYFHARHYERYAGGLDILRRAAALFDIPVVATVMPGYDDRRIRKPGFALPRGDGSRWRHDWALARGADWVLLTSFNEWHEGSEIEPSKEHGQTWLDETAAQVRSWKATP